MPIESWFPVPIFFEQVPDSDALNREVLPHLYRLSRGRRTHQPLVTGPSYSGSNAPTSAQYLQMVRELAPLYRIIHDRASQFARQLDINLDVEHLYLGRSWVNILGAGGQIQPHNHMAALFSGVYYVKVPQAGTTLRFVDPKAPIRKDPVYRGGRTPFNLGHVDYTVQEGMLMLFPGFITHGMTAPHPGPDDRVTVSFDYYSLSLEGQSPPPPPVQLVQRLWGQLRADLESKD